jgi:hypothetical protein
MVLTRREFGKTVSGGALAIGLGTLSMGVSCGTVYQDIETYVPIGLAAFNEIISLVDPALAKTLSPIINLVKASFADLLAAINEYLNAPASEKATLIEKIKLAINVVIDNLNQFWVDAGIPDGTLAQTIVGILQLVISTLAAFLPLIGGALVSKKQLAKTIPVIPRSKAQLKKKVLVSDINAVFASHGYANRIY